ncbi:MAG TPA: HAMP domain-containing sensor histidine kinase [bacterium]|nr:HAMP domain-containing sensor histidine kinase [bacterium]HPR88152.1 HAMP domain-containing sensor histidine kinase [bacterium]
MNVGDDYIRELTDHPDEDAAAILDHFIRQWSRGTTFRSLGGHSRSELVTCLARILHDMGNAGEYRQLCEQILDACLETVPADRALLLLRNTQGKLAVTVARGAELSDAVLQDHHDVIQRVLCSRQPQVTVQEDQPLESSVRWRCFFPVVSSRSLNGVLYLDGITGCEEGQVPAVAQIWSELLALLVNQAHLSNGKELLNGYLRTMQEKVIWFDKFAGQGRLAASAGHELNNLLTVLAGNLELAKSWLQKGERPERIRERLDLLESVVQNALMISQGLSSSDPQESQMQRCSLTGLVVETVDLLKPLVSRQGARFAVMPAADLPDVLVDAAQIRQVVRNLLLYAIEARSDVQIEIRIEHDSEAQRVKLQIHDNGPGMAKTQLAALFSPMQAGQERTFSLMISKEIIERHEGSLRIESEAGVGSTCMISLPRYGAETQLYWRKKINRSE